MILIFKNNLLNCRFPHGVFIHTSLADSLGSPASVYLLVQSSSPLLHSTAVPILTLESFFSNPGSNLYFLLPGYAYLTVT